METTVGNSIPAFDLPLMNAFQAALEQMRKDIKEFTFNNTLCNETWKATLPYPLCDMSDYTFIRRLLQMKSTVAFWEILSNIYDESFTVYGADERAEMEDILYVNNVDPDDIDNNEPQSIPNYPAVSTSNSHYIYIVITYKNSEDSYTSDEIYAIRTAIRLMVNSFKPVNRTISQIINNFPS